MQFGLFYEAPEGPRFSHAERYADEDAKQSMARCADEGMPKV
jgi:hypothetical protein